MSRVVPALEGAEIHIARVHELLDEGLHLPLMPLVGSADECIIREVEHAHDLLKLGRILVCESLRFHALLGCRLLDLLPMLVGAGQKEHVFAKQPLKSGPDVANGRRVHVSNMRAVIDVVDGCRD